MRIEGYHGTHIGNETNISNFGYKKSKEDEYLGKGVYFFENAPFCDALEEAKCFCEFVKKYKIEDIIVYQAIIESEKVLDLVDNIEHRKLFDRAKELVKLKLNLSTSANDNRLEDYRIFELIEKKFEVIRAMIEAAKKEKNFFTHIVRRPQIQICVKELSTITSNNIVYRYNIGRYKTWTTE